MVYKFENNDSLYSLLISEDCVKSMIFELNKHYPKEFGGILVGVKGDAQSIIVDIKTPDTFETSKSTFLRKNEGLNEYLSDLYSKSDGKLEYLGEWHSHPNGTTDYSKDDEKSMLRIANDKNVDFPEPFLLIFSLQKNEFKMAVYKIIQNKIVKFKVKKS